MVATNKHWMNTKPLVSRAGFVLLCFIIVATSVFLPRTAFAVASQDTYTWQRNIGTYGCSPGPNYLTIAGNKMYITDGTSTNTVTAYMFDLSGNSLGSFGSYGTNDGQVKYPGGVAHDAAGNIYIVDAGNYRVEKFDANNNFLMKFGSQGTGNGQFQRPGAIAIDAAGNIYVGDSTRHNVQKFDSSGSFLMKFGSQGTGNGQFSTLQSIALDGANNIYVADSDQNTVSRIQVFDSTGTYVRQFGSVGTGNGQFKYLQQIALDSTGNILATDGNNRVQKFTNAGAYLSQFGSTGTGNGQFDAPSGVTIDSAGNIYVANADYTWTSTANRIQKFDSAGNYLLQFTYSTPQNLCGPQAAAIGPDGNLYVTDSNWWWGGWDNVKVYDKSGNLLRSFGSNGTGPGQLQNPAGLAFDKSGNVYVVDQGNRTNARVEKFSPDGAYLAQIGSAGTGNGQFTSPYGIAIDATGSIFVSDSSTGISRIEKFDANGNYVSQFGSYGTGNGQFSFPAGIAMDTLGNIYVNDTTGRIQKFDSNGNYVSQFTTTASTTYGVAVDAMGSIYVSDGWGKGVQKFDNSGNFLVSFDPNGSNPGEYPGYTLGVAVDLDGNVYAVDNGTADDGTPSRISVWNAPIVPSDPQAITITSPTATSLNVSWMSPAHTGTSPLLGYKILYRSAGSVVGAAIGTSFGFGSLPFAMFGALPTGSWATAGTTNTSTLNYTISGLSPNTMYDVQVVAFNSVGSSSDVLVSQAALPYVVGTTLGGTLAATGDDIRTAAGASMVLLITGFTLMIIRKTRSQ